VEGARAVRVLNALRAPGVGMALTAGQYEALTPTGVVKRLIRYGRPGLATRVCAYLRLEDEVCAMARCARATAVLAAASGKDYSEADTAEVVAALLADEDGGYSMDEGRGTKRGPAPGLYSTVALAAHKSGRTGVASQLLNMETDKESKVKGLLAIEDWGGAASVAANAQDDDLMFLTLQELERHCLEAGTHKKNSAGPADALASAEGTFLRTVTTKFPFEVRELLRAYYDTRTDPSAVVALLCRENKLSEAGAAIARRALAPHISQRERRLMLRVRVRDPDSCLCTEIVPLVDY